MNIAMIEEHLENIDRRLTSLEQILPTLATKADLQRAIEPLATRQELRRAIEPLATREELRRAIEPLATREELFELGRHLTMSIEHQDGKISLLIDYVQSLRPRRPE